MVGCARFLPADRQANRAGHGAAYGGGLGVPRPSAGRLADSGNGQRERRTKAEFSFIRGNQKKFAVTAMRNGRSAFSRLIRSVCMM